MRQGGGRTACHRAAASPSLSLVGVSRVCVQWGGKDGCAGHGGGMKILNAEHVTQCVCVCVLSAVWGMRPLCVAWDGHTPRALGKSRQYTTASPEVHYHSRLPNLTAF